MKKKTSKQTLYECEFTVFLPARFPKSALHKFGKLFREYQVNKLEDYYVQIVESGSGEIKLAGAKGQVYGPETKCSCCGEKLGTANK